MKCLISKTQTLEIFKEKNNIKNHKIIMRIDDYPTGVRQTNVDLKTKLKFLKMIDKCDIPFVLAIVPTLCSKEDFEILKSLKNLIPAMHGINHGNAQFGQLITENHDMSNEKTILKPFNELKIIPTEYIKKVLKAHKMKLESNIEKNVNIFIPPSNRINLIQLNQVMLAGFEQVMFDRKKYKFFLRYPLIGSNFYGKSPNYSGEIGLITLHFTWELDLIKEHGSANFEGFLNQISKHISITKK